MLFPYSVFVSKCDAKLLRLGISGGSRLFFSFISSTLLKRFFVPGGSLVATKNANKLCDLIGAFGKEDAIQAEAREQSEKDRERQPKATGPGKICHQNVFSVAAGCQEAVSKNAV